MSFSISLCLHLLIFGLVGLSFLKPPQFAVDEGKNGMEVNLVAAPSELMQQEVIQPPVEPKSELVEQEVVQPQPVAKPQEAPTQDAGKDQTTVQSMGGAITEAKPDYLKNPAPSYPESARRKGYEGTVLLTALISKEGSPIEVKVEQSSGHSSLDEAALKAVRKWSFRPGQIGNMPVESTVHVPVRFDLKDAS